MKFAPKITIAVIVIVLVIVAGVIFFGRQNQSLISKSQTPAGSDSPTLAASAENSGGIGEYYTGEQEATGEATPVPSPEAISEFIYPGAQVKNQTASKLELESSASADTITNWYKTKISQLEFNAKSFSQTNTNNNILNRLSAAKPGDKIDITIKKDQNGSNVSITVDRS